MLESGITIIGLPHALQSALSVPAHGFFLSNSNISERATQSADRTVSSFVDSQHRGMRLNLTATKNKKVQNQKSNQAHALPAHNSIQKLY